MPAIFVPIAVFLLQILQPIIARVLVALGLSVVTFKGFDLLTDAVLDHVIASYNGMPSLVAQFFAMLGADTAFTILLSAHVAGLALAGIRDGAKRIVAGASE